MDSALGESIADDSMEINRPIRLGGFILAAQRHICAFFNSPDDQYRSVRTCARPCSGNASGRVAGPFGAAVRLGGAVVGAGVAARGAEDRQAELQVARASSHRFRDLS